MENRKSRMTRMVFHDALVELLEEKPISRVSVTEICERADFNRSTFYAHYTDPSDLLKEIEDTFMEEHTKAVSKTGVGVEEILTDYLVSQQRDARTFRVLLSQAPAFRRRILDSARILYTKDVALAKYSSGKNEGQKLDFIAAGSLFLIEKWLSDPEPESAASLALLICQLMQNVMRTR